MSQPCEAKCGQYFASIKSMNSHLSSAKSCSCYAKAKLRDLGVNDIRDTRVSLLTSIMPNLVHGQIEEGEGWQEYDPQQDPDISMEFGPYGNELQFLPDEPAEPQL